MTNTKEADGVDFAGLLLGFSSAALYYMGEGEVQGRQPVKNLTLARQNIDIIRLLKEKSEGNRTADESRLIDQLISDLQVKVVEAGR